MEKKVAVLFARKDSVYKSMEICDVYDIERDALTFSGKIPIIAHPPCRAWGRLWKLAKPRPGEKELAFFAVDKIRENGGVLEHPSGSKLWDEYGLPYPGDFDQFGGWTLKIHQSWFGHKAEKKTWLYIVGVTPAKIPSYPLKFDAITHRVGSCNIKGSHGWKPEVSKKEREATPPDLAKYLVKLALISSKNKP